MANEDSQRDSSPRRSQGSSGSAAEEVRPEAIDPLIGRQLDGLSILEPLGARVYKARQRSPDRLVALKVLPEDAACDALAVSLLRAEARAAAAVSHPNSIVVHALDAEARPPFLVMEYVPGESLAALLAREGRLTVARAAPIMKAVANALAKAHAAGIIHCGIQPSHILITPRAQVKLAGFALARQVLK